MLCSPRCPSARQDSTRFSNMVEYAWSSALSRPPARHGSHARPPHAPQQSRALQHTALVYIAAIPSLPHYPVLLSTLTPHRTFVTLIQISPTSNPRLFLSGHPQDIAILNPSPTPRLPHTPQHPSCALSPHTSQDIAILNPSPIPRSHTHLNTPRALPLSTRHRTS